MRRVDGRAALQHETCSRTELSTSGYVGCKGKSFLLFPSNLLLGPQYEPEIVTVYPNFEPCFEVRLAYWYVHCTAGESQCENRLSKQELLGKLIDQTACARGPRRAAAPWSDMSTRTLDMT